MNFKDQLYRDLNPITSIKDSAYPNPPIEIPKDVPVFPEGEIIDLQIQGQDKAGGWINLKSLRAVIEWENGYIGEVKPIWPDDEFVRKFFEYCFNQS